MIAAEVVIHALSFLGFIGILVLEDLVDCRVDCLVGDAFDKVALDDGQ